MLIARLVPDIPTPSGSPPGGSTPSGAPLSGAQVGFAGIAKPWRFEAALRAAGVELADFAAFPDHAAFRPRDLVFLRARAALYGAGLVTTEKDWVRLPAELRGEVTPWPVRAVFEDEQALSELLAPIVGGSR